MLTDFRAVEHNFRALDRQVRERIALWEGGKGALLEEIMGERDAISDSDQGRSFRAFWEFLMSSSRQEELTDRLARVLALTPIVSLRPEPRTRRVHYDWLEAGEHTQRTVAQLSQQLRRFLDDQAWLENRRIMDILRGIEAKSLALRGHQPVGPVMHIDDVGAAIELPLERPLFTPALKASIRSVELLDGDEDIDASALYSQIVVDPARITRHIRRSLQARAQITLRELIDTQPLEHGLPELVAYLQIGDESFATTVSDETLDVIEWTTSPTTARVSASARGYHA